MPRFGGMGRAFSHLGSIAKKGTGDGGGGGPAAPDDTTGASEFLFFFM